MSALSGFWVIVLLLVVFFFLLSLREVFLLIKMRHDHPERGLYWFNSFFLLCASGMCFLGGLYPDAGRVDFEKFFYVYPASRYAHEQNSIVRKEEWVYVSKDTKEAIFNFYKSEAKKRNIEFVDNRENDRMSFLLPSGPLYLTLHDEGEERTLYFTRMGSTSVVQ